MIASAHHAAGTSAGATILGIVLVLAALVMYWLPTIIAAIRHVPHIGSVAVVDAFLGWTVIGWVVALSMACRSRRTEVVPMVQQPPPPVPPAGYGRARG